MCCASLETGHQRESMVVCSRCIPVLRWCFPVGVERREHECRREFVDVVRQLQLSAARLALCHVVAATLLVADVVCLPRPTTRQCAGSETTAPGTLITGQPAD
ncbi:hypothetical protein L209DRAFT_755175 [Thermothelomyces heterothallicus CBS 203.75]